MILLISGSRNYTNYEALKKAVKRIEQKTGKKTAKILHGGAKGADTLAQRYATENQLPYAIIRPNYKNHPPKVAPLLRNTTLVEKADATLCLYGPGRDGKGGTADTARKTLTAKKPLLVRNSNGNTDYQAPTLTLF